MNISWNAEAYTKNFSFVHQYGSDLIALIDGEGLSVLDLGCGNGALTHRLPRRSGLRGRPRPLGSTAPPPFCSP